MKEGKVKYSVKHYQRWLNVGATKLMWQYEEEMDKAEGVETKRQYADLISKLWEIKYFLDLGDPEAFKIDLKEQKQKKKKK